MLIMRLEIFEDDKKLDFENSLYFDEYSQKARETEEYKPIPISFSEVHYLLNEKNKYYLELAFQHQLKESIDGR